MSKSLINSFSNSIVRQLGRDTGKVISNSIYKNRNASNVNFNNSQNYNNIGSVPVYD